MTPAHDPPAQDTPPPPPPHGYGRGRDTIELRYAESPQDLDEIRTLFREYAGALGFDLDFQGFEEELAALPAEYAGPAGTILLATVGGAVAGCVALRPLEEPGVCEMKRMYVRPAFRGLGLGRVLGVRVMEEARRRGYRAMRLDTIDTMTPAITLYESLGFRRIGAYRFNPIPGALYFEATLGLEPAPGRV